MEKTKRCPYCGEEMGNQQVNPINKNRYATPNIIAIIVVVMMDALASCSSGPKEKENARDIIENQAEAEISKQVLEAYNNHKIHELMTPEFKAAEDAAMEAQSLFGEVFFDADIFYNTQDEIPDVVEVSEIKLVEKDKAHVKVMYMFRNNMGNRVDSTVLVRVSNNQASGLIHKKWLVDDVRQFHVNERRMTVSYSQKAAMNQFVNDIFTAHAYIEDEYNDDGPIYEVDDYGNMHRVGEY